MPTGIEFFLTQCVQNTDKDPRGWDWHVLDNERLHQDLLQVLLNHSPEFSECLFGAVAAACVRQPEGQLFDLLVTTTAGPEIFVEIKVDQSWTQRQRQLDFLIFQKPQARSAMVLFSQSAVRIKRAELRAALNGRISKLTYKELYVALDVVRQTATQHELVELAFGYSAALRQQDQRTRERFGDPDT